MSKLSLWTTISLVCVFCAVEVIASPAQTFTTLVNFDGANGYIPNAVVQGLDGDLYGTTAGGGANNNSLCNDGPGCGTVFKITPGGLTTLYSFCSRTNCTDGASPDAGLVLGTDGNFYGTTLKGGANGYGTVFKITPGGTLTTLHSLCSQSGCTDGELPFAGLVQAIDGNFYGTTLRGGANANCADGCGTVFKITPSGTLTTLHSFDSTDGANPYAGLVQATDRNFYGTTASGGASSACLGGCGTVFKITPSGTLTTLHSFDSTDGFELFAGLVQAIDGNFYGTTAFGGASSNCGAGCGTVFKITPSGTLTTLHSFDSTDGAGPYGALVQGTDGNLYGTTVGGGANNYGTIFKVTPGGTLTTLHSFDSTDGANPQAALVQDTNGKFYGTTAFGGTNNDGTVFSLSVGLGPFVKTLPTSGKVGTAVIILGNNLTGATSVTFNGTAASFSVVSSSEIKATVPKGATTGKVKVTTPSRTLTSNVNFRVTPTISSFSPTSGPVGTSVVITGESFTGATSVTFGGVKATSFTVNPYTQITATVPTGAKTGKIGVTTPGGTAVSAGTFTVT